MTSTQSQAGFPDTSWTLIEAINQTNHPFHRDALQQLAKSYWQPVYVYLRRIGKTREDAADIAQAYFAEVVLERGIFAQATRSRGRLRNLVLVSLKNFLIDAYRETTARQANRILGMADLGEEDRMLSGDEGEPDRSFDRRWALSVLHEAMHRCESQFRSNGKQEYWKAFDARDVRPSVSMSPPPSYEQIAKDLAFTSADQAIHAVRMVRKRMMALMRQIVAETAEGSDDQQSEYDHVVGLLS